ncbi:MAG: hypothetical protein Q9174_001749 [Haloplaca sp. 1 TL-2023]
MARSTKFRSVNTERHGPTNVRDSRGVSALDGIDTIDAKSGSSDDDGDDKRLHDCEKLSK